MSLVFFRSTKHIFSSSFRASFISNSSLNYFFIKTSTIPYNTFWFRFIISMLSILYTCLVLLVLILFLFLIAPLFLNYSYLFYLLCRYVLCLFMYKLKLFLFSYGNIYPIYTSYYKNYFVIAFLSIYFTVK